MTTKAKTRKASAAKSADPVFAAIAEHKVLVKEWRPLIEKLANAECEAFETHGLRPVALEGLQAKEKFAAAKRAGVEWDHRAGIATVHEQEERAINQAISKATFMRRI